MYVGVGERVLIRLSLLSVRYKLRLKKQLSIKHIVQLPQLDVSTRRDDFKHLVCSKNKHAVCIAHRHLQFTAVDISVKMAHVLICQGMNIRIHGDILYDKYVTVQNCVHCTVSSAYCTSLSFLHIAISFIMVTVQSMLVARLCLVLKFITS